MGGGGVVFMALRNQAGWVVGSMGGWWSVGGHSDTYTSLSFLWGTFEIFSVVWVQIGRKMGDGDAEGKMSRGWRYLACCWISCQERVLG